MAFSHGKDFQVQLGSAGSPAVLVDISAYCTSCSFPREKETAETSAFSDASKSRVAGLVDGSFSLEGIFDPTIDAQLEGLLEYTGIDLDFQIDPQVGGPSYDGHCICTSYEITGSVGDAVTWSAEFEITGDVTRT